mgnify:CR=1 FL=1
MNDRDTQTRLQITASLLLNLYWLFLIVYCIARFVVRWEARWLNLLYNGMPYLFLVALIAFVIMILVGAGRLALRYLLLLIIAGIIWGLRILPVLDPTPPPPDAIALDVVTFNVYPQNQELDAVQEWLMAQSADIVLLQEVGAPLSRLIEVYPHRDVLQTPNENRHYVLSRYPILEAEDIDVEDSVQQRVVLDVDGQAVTVYNVHLWMPLDDNADRFLLLRYDETRRNRQISTVIARANSETNPTIIGGDFNMSEFSPIYDTIARNFGDVYRHTRWQLGFSWPAGASEELGNWLPPLVRLDYVWHSAPFVPIDASLGVPLGSDHLPLHTTLALP